MIQGGAGHAVAHALAAGVADGDAVSATERQESEGERLVRYRHGRLITQRRYDICGSGWGGTCLGGVATALADLAGESYPLAADGPCAAWLTVC